MSILDGPEYLNFVKAPVSLRPLTRRVQVRGHGVGVNIHPRFYLKRHQKHGKMHDTMTLDSLDTLQWFFDPHLQSNKIFIILSGTVFLFNCQIRFNKAIYIKYDRN